MVGRERVEEGQFKKWVFFHVRERSDLATLQLWEITLQWGLCTFVSVSLQGMWPVSVFIADDVALHEDILSHFLNNGFKTMWMFSSSYLGRNRVDWSGTEARIATWLVQPDYSHFLVGYLLSSRGAQKLLDADPFHSLLPADDFITVMYGRPLWYIHSLTYI